MAVCRNEFCLCSKTVDPWKKNEFSVGFAGRENRVQVSTREGHRWTPLASQLANYHQRQLN